MSTQKLSINQDLTIYQAMDIKQTVDQALATTADLEMDLSQVAEIDTAGLQILIYAKREANRLGKHLSITAHSPAVRQTLDFCNLAGFFGDPVVITAHENL